MDYKPLPALPALGVLSVDARQHRARLIRSFLSEIHEPTIESRQEGWVNVLEETLDELGQCLSKGKWLQAVRTWREQQRLAWKRKQEMEKERQLQEVLKGKKAAKAQDDKLGKTQDDKPTKPLDNVENGEPEALPSSKELPFLPAVMPKGEAKNLLLCVAPPAEDSGSDMISANIGCAFIPGAYSLEDATVLFGNKEVELDEAVGGTFVFRGVTSPSQHQHLVRILRLTTYVHLSLILEQHLLADSNIALVFPRPKPPPPSPTLPARSATTTSIDRPPEKPTHPSFLPPAILSFFSKKSRMGKRASTVTPVIGRDPGPNPMSAPAPGTPPRQSLDGGTGTGFRFSILGTPAKKPSAPEPVPAPEAKMPYTRTLERVQAHADLLSTSPGVRFDPPALLGQLAAREQGAGGVRLRADERVALMSVLGWEGTGSAGQGMAGAAGFLKQQGIEVLLSRHVPDPEAEEEWVACGRPVGRTYRYYTRDEEDVSLGEAVVEFAEAAGRPCVGAAGRPHLMGLHETRLVHGGMKVIMRVDEREEAEEYEGECEGEGGPIGIWESCVKCGSRSGRRQMSDGTYLLSFGKFLELLIYSPAFGLPSPALCAHTERLDVRRHFGTRTHKVSITCARVEDIYKLKVPPLQITRAEGGLRDPTMVQAGAAGGGGGGAKRAEEKEGDEERQELRVEIKLWWEGMADHMEKLEGAFRAADARAKSKALPRLPSTDTDIDSDSDSDGAASTLTQGSLPASLTSTNTLPGANEVSEPHSGTPTPPSTPIQPRPTSNAWEEEQRRPDQPQQQPEPKQRQPDQGPQPEKRLQHPAVRLVGLRQTFHRTEQSLYLQLSHSSKSSLNDVRRSFLASAKGAEKRLGAWQKKHLDGSEEAKSAKERGNTLQWVGSVEPAWWKPGCHALPGSNVIIKDDDLGSIIAFTLSSGDYQWELNSMYGGRPVSTTTQPSQPSTPASSFLPPDQPTYSSFFSSAMNYKRSPGTISQTDPDPDLDDATWDAPELFSAVVSRKEHPRDPTSSLLSLREILRQQQKSPVPDQLRLGSLGRGPAPPSAWAKPDVQLSMDEADGKVSAEGPEGVGKILQGLDTALAGESSRPSSRVSESDEPIAGSHFTAPVETAIHRGHAAPILSEDAAAVKENWKEVGKNVLESQQPPPLPPKDEQHMYRDEEPPRDVTVTDSVPSSSTFATALANGLGNAVRYVLHSGGSSGSGVGVGSPADASVSRPLSPHFRGHHGLLSLDAAGIDERPHVKYDWTVGKRLKFSCTVYYAKQFDILRRRCGVDEIYMRSLRHSANWHAEGGKSRSNFWKSGDDRFIIKTLVHAWNVADLHVLIDLAPAYFRYMDATVNRPTVLTKMLGFYTVEIRNLETGAVQCKTDLLVMENVFYKEKIAKTFDLKGIPGRKVKPASGFKVAQNPTTLYDGEWIEDQQKTMMVIRPHCHHVLRLAVKSDAEFLAKGNIMDYSLLVGVIEDRKEIVCGLVDTIGSYTFARTLEYKAKQGFAPGKSPTIIPPTEYQERFLSAIESYFLACPDKWSKPADESKIITDVELLPSVL